MLAVMEAAIPPASAQGGGVVGGEAQAPKMRRRGSAGYSPPGRGPALPHRLKRIRELGEAYLLPLQIHSIPVVEVLARRVGEPEDLLGDLEPQGRGPAQSETPARELYGWGQRFLE